MVFFDDISTLHRTLRRAYEQVPSESRHAFISQRLESWGFSEDQAQLCASNVLTQNVEGSADFARTNAMHVMGSWVRGEQEGAVGSWLRYNEGDLEVQYGPYVRAQDREGTSQVYQRGHSSNLPIRGQQRIVSGAFGHLQTR